MFTTRVDFSGEADAAALALPGDVPMVTIVDLSGVRGPAEVLASMGDVAVSAVSFMFATVDLAERRGVVAERAVDLPRSSWEPSLCGRLNGSALL